MDSAHQLAGFVDLFERLGVTVRREHLGGSGCNLCRLKGETVLFFDLDADLATQLNGCAEAAAQISEVDQTYLPPELRERIDRVR